MNVPTAVSAAYLPIFDMASLRVIWFLMFLFSFKESLGNPLFILIMLSMGGGGVALLPMMAMQGDMSNELIITLGWCLYGVYKVYGEKSG